MKGALRFQDNIRKLERNSFGNLDVNQDDEKVIPENVVFIDQVITNFMATPNIDSLYANRRLLPYVSDACLGALIEAQFFNNFCQLEHNPQVPFSAFLEIITAAITPGSRLVDPFIQAGIIFIFKRVITNCQSAPNDILTSLIACQYLFSQNPETSLSMFKLSMHTFVINRIQSWSRNKTLLINSLKVISAALEYPDTFIISLRSFSQSLLLGLVPDAVPYALTLMHKCSRHSGLKLGSFQCERLARCFMIILNTFEGDVIRQALLIIHDIFVFGESMIDFYLQYGYMEKFLEMYQRCPSERQIINSILARMISTDKKYAEMVITSPFLELIIKSFLEGPGNESLSASNVICNILYEAYVPNDVVRKLFTSAIYQQMKEVLETEQDYEVALIFDTLYSVLLRADKEGIPGIRQSMVNDKAFFEGFISSENEEIAAYAQNLVSIL